MELNLEKIYSDNMIYLQNNMPGLYEDINKADINEYELIPNESGINVSINGNKLYPDDVNNAIHNQVDKFIKEPVSFFKRPTRNFDEKFDYIHDDYMMNIEQASPYLKENRIFTNYYHNMDNLFPYMLILGVGTGKHIELLVQNSDIKNMIIIDEDYCFLKISMHLIDWRPIIKYFNRDGYQLSFTISKKSDILSRIAINALFKRFPYLQYYIPYFLHYNSNFFTEFKKAYLDKINLGFTGLGFYDDEVLSLNHTIENINNNRAIFLNNKPLPQNSSVFIIGTGPSIDKDIENIKKLKDDAIIFSCGTALKVLEANNIIPDYHFESERPPRMYEYIADNISKEYLKKIDFIGVNVIYPKVLTLFKTAKIFFRSNDCGSSIAIDDIPKLDHCNPTVVNAAISFAAKIGFKNIYMFGTDMGYRDEENHHSKHSSYSDKNSAISKLKPTTINKSFIGNFDENEKFLSTIVLEWCKQRVENCINDYKFKEGLSINYYNCSDGLAIKQTIPLRSSKITLDEKSSKKDILSDIEKNFSHDFKDIHQKLQENLLGEKKIYIKKVDEIINIIESNPIKSYSTLVDMFDKTFNIGSEIIENTYGFEDSSFIRSLLRGSLFHFYSAIYTHALAMTDKEASFIYIDESLKKVISFLTLTKDALKEKNID